MTTGQCIVSVGNPFIGLTLYGPFDNAILAGEWAENNSTTDLKNEVWTIVFLQSPVADDILSTL
jgi:hypothetical protein